MPDPEHFDDADMAELGDLVRRAGADDVEWDSPPPELWDRIAASLADEPVGAAGQDEPAATTAAPAGDVVPMVRRRRWWVGLAAAAAVMVVVAVSVVRSAGDDDGRVVSAVELERLGDTGSGRAELVERGGQLQLRVDATELDAGDGYLELWMIDPSVSRLVSLGPLRPDGVYDVPARVDPAEFPIVDVSVEPVDGDPTHSGQSVLRGRLDV
jgi:hypothetical protein